MLCLETHHIFVSRDVAFHGTVFPYQIESFVSSDTPLPVSTTPEIPALDNFNDDDITAEQ